MKLIVKKKFRDVEDDVIRNRNDVFKPTKERAEYILKHAPHLVEIYEGQSLEEEKKTAEYKVTEPTDVGTEDNENLSKLTVTELKNIAREKEITNYSTMRKDELIEVLSE